MQKEDRGKERKNREVRCKSKRERVQVKNMKWPIRQPRLSPKYLKVSSEATVARSSSGRRIQSATVLGKKE